jgi:hypothetical protein
LRRFDGSDSGQLHEPIHPTRFLTSKMFHGIEVRDLTCYR